MVEMTISQKTPLKDLSTQCLSLHLPLTAVLLDTLKHLPLPLSKQKKAIPSPCTWFGVISALISHCYFVFPSSILFMGEGCTFLCIEMGTYLWKYVHFCVRACGGRRMTLVIISIIFVPHSLRFLSDIQSSPIWL